jgi:hypothetical protein
MADAMRSGMGGGQSGGGGGGDGGGGGKSVGDQLREIAALHKDGILSDEEFAQKKAELLKRL